MKMNRFFSLVLMLGLIAAAGYAQDEQAVTTIDDYIEVNELKKVSKVRTAQNDNTSFLNTGFAIYHSGKRNTLIKFRRECQALNMDRPTVPDTRTTRGYLTASSDTLRGCRIAAMHPLEEHQVGAIKALAGK